MLAGLFKAPAKFAPHINLPAARARANVVLDNLVEAGFMTEGQVFGARRNPAIAIDRRDDRSPNYFLDWAFEGDEEAGRHVPEDDDRACVPGAHRARLRPAARRRAGGREFAAPVRPRLSRQPDAAVVADLDGAVRAMVGGRDYGQSQFNRAIDALRQPGSSFKPYVYATALMNGFKPTSIVVDGPICIGNWCPQNYRPLLCRLGDLTHRDHRIDQHHRGAAFDLARQRQRPDRPQHDRRDRQGHGPAHAAARHAVAADRRRRGDRARSHRRVLRPSRTPARRSRRTRCSRCAPATAK